MSIIKKILQKAVELDASDVHLKADAPPFFRIHGELSTSDFPKMSDDDLKCVVIDILPEHIKRKSDPENEMDFSHYEEDAGRFRVNVFLSHHVPTLALRYVKTEIPSIADLHLPEILERLMTVNSGIIMVCGATSSGKSTSLAAMIHCINTTCHERIITIEDPVEYIFKDIQSVITQREVGLDTPSFHSALKHVLRQDPDVIMIGEMRDQISLSVALSAAETGHVVLSTLHSTTADQSIHRILSFFPAEEREQVRLAVAANLTAILCQRLIPSIRGGVLPAVEIMINTPTVHKLLLGNKLETLHAAIETGKEDGMQTFNQALFKMIKSGQVTEKEGMAQSPNSEALKMNLEGIFLDDGHRILGE